MVYGLTLLFLGHLCSNTVIFHHEGSVSIQKANIDQINLIKLGTMWHDLLPECKKIDSLTVVNNANTVFFKLV